MLIKYVLATVILSILLYMFSYYMTIGIKYQMNNKCCIFNKCSKFVCNILPPTFMQDQYKFDSFDSLYYATSNNII